VVALALFLSLSCPPSSSKEEEKQGKEGLFFPFFLSTGAIGKSEKLQTLEEKNHFSLPLSKEKLFIFSFSLSLSPTFFRPKHASSSGSNCDARVACRLPERGETVPGAERRARRRSDDDDVEDAAADAAGEIDNVVVEKARRACRRGGQAAAAAAAAGRRRHGS